MVNASRIEQLRQQKGYTLRELAERCQMEPANLTRILKGRVKGPRLTTLQRIAQALGVPVHELFCESTSEAANEARERVLAGEGVEEVAG